MMTNNYDLLYDLKLMKRKGKDKRKNIIELNNITAIDTESTSGFVNGKSFVPYNKKIYMKKIKEYVKEGNLPCTYKSPYRNLKSVGFMYIWMITVEIKKNQPITFFGRTYKELQNFIDTLNEVFLNYKAFNKSTIPDGSDADCRNFLASQKRTRYILHMYCHNLGWDFQFLRNFFNFKNIFAREKRKPMRCEVEYDSFSIVFHDTLCLTQKSLAKWAEDAQLPIKKMSGDLNYDVVRNSQTILTTQELGYCEHDTLVIYEGIKDYRDNIVQDDLCEIPMTQTGFPRRKLIDKSKVDSAYKEMCYEINSNLSFELYNKLIIAFTGGWTHANQKYSGKLLKNVVCFDFASSYPSVMTSCKYPMESFKEVDPNMINSLQQGDIEDRDIAYLIEVEVDYIESNIWNSYLSSSKCLNSEQEKKNWILDNGKIVEADNSHWILTDVDYEIMLQCYDCQGIHIKHLYTAKYDYMPLWFIEVILEYFQYKTSLKGTNNVSKYNESKQFINAIYGVEIQRILNDVIDFVNNNWEEREGTEIEYYECVNPNNGKAICKLLDRTFSSYQFGVWVTAWAKFRLFKVIYKYDDITAYGDTDSCKGLFDKQAIQWVQDFNENYITKQQEKVAKHYGFAIDKFKATTSNGKIKQLGILEREHDCVEFKALRAKVYADSYYDKQGKLKIETTIAGLPKRIGPTKIKKVDDLKDGLFFNAVESGKNVLHYNDTQPSFTVEDRQGHIETIDCQFGVSLEPTSFNLEINEEYKNLLNIIDNYGDNDYFNTTTLIRKFQENYLTD